MLTEKRTSTSIPINIKCHNKKKYWVWDQIEHFILPKQISSYQVRKNPIKIWGLYVHKKKIVCVDLNNCCLFNIKSKYLNSEDIDRIIEMAWEDRTPFEAIEFQFELNEAEVIQLMRLNLKSSSFKIWRKRVSGRKTKHGFSDQITRFRSTNQKWKLNWKKNVLSVKENLSGERNGPKTGQMWFTARRDAEDEKIKNKVLNEFITPKKDFS